MSQIEDVILAIDEMNARFPRPGLVLKVVGPYDLKSSFRHPYPNVGLAGVYVLTSADGTVLRIGKASCSRKLDERLADYFRRDIEPGVGIAKNAIFNDVRYVNTIGVPLDRAFEAPAIEEFLLRRIQAPLNKFGVAEQTAQPDREDAAPG